MKSREINPCRPGYGASCSLCCGSHNYRMSYEEVSSLFSERGVAGAQRPYMHPFSVTKEKLYRDAMQCPHVALDFDDEIYCLMYNERDKKGEILTFFNGTCSNFYCPAWDDLTDRQVVFAARLMHDWYYYSLLINDIEAVQNLCAEYDSPGDVPHEAVEELKAELMERFIAEDGK